MDKLIKSKRLYIIPILFFLIVIAKISYSYYDIKKMSQNFAQDEMQVFNKHLITNKIYYQNLFTNTPQSQDATPPDLLKENYENAYEYFFKYFLITTLYDILLFISLFIAIFYLLQKSKKLNSYLEYEVQARTRELKNTLLVDRLTNLPNRIQLIEDIRIQKNYPSNHLALLNIDRFKDINDFYGHSIGDKLLIKVLHSIQEKTTDNRSIVYKLPSDEYALYSIRNISASEFREHIEDVIKIIESTEYSIDSYTMFVTLSCGIASNIDDILTKANMALQIAKGEKKGIVAYDTSIDISSMMDENIQGVKLLKDALEHDRITPYFQAIYNVKKSKVEKFECLARIVQEDGSVLSPYHFMEIAIKSKLYPQITKIMLAKSFEYFNDKEYEFSINLSISDISNYDVMSFILEKLKSYKNPQRVVFEILEDDEISNYQKLKEFIDTVKGFGCKIAIDDFGSGYSNFSHILELNVDFLKIDASLVKNVLSDEKSRKITQIIINLSKTLEVQTIAEFVEDEASKKLLEEMGADFIQGYHIAKPQPEV
ncbi:EAL domain-containing protein [Sulfurimonas sp.]